MKSVFPIAMVLFCTPAVLAAQQIRTAEQLLCDLQDICGEDAAAEIAIADGSAPQETIEDVDFAGPGFRLVDGSSGAKPAGGVPDRPQARTKADRPVVSQPDKPTRRRFAPSRANRDGMAGGSGLAVPVPAGVKGRGELTVTFANDSAVLTGESIRQVEAFAVLMRAPSMQGQSVRIEGHTDAVGSEEYNRDLSRRRAQAVVAALVERQVDGNLLKAEGYGFDQPMAGLQPKHPANRRVEAVLIKPVEAGLAK